MDKIAKKNAIYSLVLLSLMGIVYMYRQWQGPPKPLVAVGHTMGKIAYNVKYFDEENRDFSEAIDSLFKAFNNSLSTYIPASEISRFNKQDSFRFESPFFYPVLAKSKEVHARTQGAFDPTVMPLVNAWGFGPEDREEMTPERVASLRQLVGFAHINFNEQEVWKDHAGVALDFSAIAKGYAIDVVGLFLERQGINDYMVLLGGEARCKGSNGVREAWVIGVDNPKYAEEGGMQGVAFLAMENMAVATSGNYRNFYVKDGKKYAHTIHPQTGYPVAHNLLSASVFAKDCMTADAYATAFMVLGLDSAKILLNQQPDIDGLLVYDEAGEMKVYMTEKLKNILVE